MRPRRVEAVHGPGERRVRGLWHGAAPTGLHDRRLRPLTMAATEEYRGCRGADEERRGKDREPAPCHQAQPGRLWTVKRRVREPAVPANVARLDDQVVDAVTKCPGVEPLRELEEVRAALLVRVVISETDLVLVRATRVDAARRTSSAAPPFRTSLATRSGTTTGRSSLRIRQVISAGVTGPYHLAASPWSDRPRRQRRSRRGRARRSAAPRPRRPSGGR